MSRLRTVSARLAPRAPRTLALLLGALLALTASCSKDYSPLIGGPGVPALIPGNFVLVSVDGKVLPHTIANSNVTIVSGDCVVRTNDTFSMNVTTATGSADPVLQPYSGFVAAFNRGSVIFQFSASGTQATALITGNGFDIPYGTVTLNFERRS